MAEDIHGILLLDKALGLSSAGAVGRVKWMFKARKAGHTGALDPLASGMLPICFGEATKFGAQLLDADKTYCVTVRLGERTPSADRESEVIERRDLPDLSHEQLRAGLERFPRAYAQIPPMHSALKQDGKPLYEYARAGIVRERAPRDILIHSMTLLEWCSPDLTFEVRCSKGTYIRVLAEDLARELGTIAHLTRLRRLGVDPFRNESVWTLDALEAMTATERREQLLPVDAALCAWPRLDLPASAARVLRRGQCVDVAAQPAENVRIYADGAEFLGVGSVQPDGRLRAQRLIAADANPA